MDDKRPKVTWTKPRLFRPSLEERIYNDAIIRRTRKGEWNAGQKYAWLPTVENPTVRAERLRCALLSTGRSQTIRQLAETIKFPGRKGADVTRAVKMLESYCARAGIDRVVLAITARDASRFTKLLSKAGLALRTVHNYRRSLATLWDHAIERDTTFMRDCRHVRGGSTLWVNPWRLTADVKLTRSGRSNTRIILRGDRSKKHDPRRAAARRFAITVVPFLKRIDPDGTLSHKEIARRLNHEGKRTRRNCLYDATAVRRLKAALAAAHI